MGDNGFADDEEFRSTDPRPVELDDVEPINVPIREFIEEMAERGLIIPGTLTLRQRIWSVITFPFKAIGRLGSRVAWSLWGKKRADIKLEQAIKRWKALAGVNRLTRFDDPQKAKQDEELRLARHRVSLNYMPRSPATAQAEHDHIIKTKIVREPLPKPDSDDRGLN